MVRRLPDVLTEQEFKKLLEATKLPHYKLAFLLGYLCGLRVSEIVKLQPEDIDAGRGVLLIRAAKGKKDRQMPYKRALVKYFKYLPITVTPRTLQIAFMRTVKRVGINKQNLSFHSLRHSFATRYLDKGGGMKNLQQMLGHSSISTTMNIYVHTSMEKVKDEYSEIFGK